MLDNIAKLPEELNRNMLSLMDEEGERFSKAVDEFSKWITDGKDAAIAMQSELLAEWEVH